MAGTRSYHRLGRWLVGVPLVFAIATAWAGPSFIDSTRVSADESGANVEIRFNCKAQYLRHEPQNSGDQLRIYLDPTGICNGVSPLVAQSRTKSRPFNSDKALIADLEYDGDSAAGPVLILNFSEPVEYSLVMSDISFDLVVRVRPTTAEAAPLAEIPNVNHRQVSQPQQASPDYVINLATLRKAPTVVELSELQLAADKRLFYSEVIVAGTTWYQLRLGTFESADAAAISLRALQSAYPGAWIDELDPNSVKVDLNAGTPETTAEQENEPSGQLPESGSLPSSEDGSSGSEADTLMAEARLTLVAGDISRAIQIYTKVLQLPEHPRHPEAQEFLALAREKNGQSAHAKAEYQRYLSLYPEHEGAARVSQRLAALLASGRQTDSSLTASGGQGSKRRIRQSDWRFQTFFSQFYRRDVNQQNDQNEIVSQSALYSDVNIDARRRGERFDFSSRLSAGYRNDFLSEDMGSGDQLRVSYAYADLSDAKTGWRGRFGRQSRNTGGVLGRFDGINLGYQASERILLNAVVGKPAYSSTDGVDSSRSFYGVSLNYGPILENLDLGVFYIDQKIEGIQDRQAVGAEFRYFGSNQSLWGMVDYDISYAKLSSAFLQGSWRFDSRLSIHALADRRGSPFLSAGNALIGQPVRTFAELAIIFSEDELRQLGLDRSPVSTTYTVGLSYPLTPKLQINADASQSTIDDSPESGGVFATPGTTYNYYSSSLIASSMFIEGDVTILGVRYSDSDTSKVTSVTLDSRYPFGSTWRINPRLRVDRRQRLLDSSYEWLYTPGIRLQYRRSQKFRIQLEAGKQISQRETTDINLDRESYFISLGYQAFF